MAAAVLTSSKLSISNPFQLMVHKRSDTASPVPDEPAASSSRLQASSPSQLLDAQPKTFKRLRSSLEQSLRTATKSRAKAGAPADENGLVNIAQGKGKERASDDPTPERDRTKSRMLSKVSFRRPVAARGPSSAAAPPVSVGRTEDKENREKDRVAGHTSFLTPSLRQASMSSPALPIPSAYTQPFALPASASSDPVPARERARKSESRSVLSTKEISGPTPLAPKRAAPSSSSPTTKARPPPLILSRNGTQSPGPDTPARRSREGTRSPEPSLPSPRTITGTSSRRATANASTNHLPLDTSPSPPASPTTRPISPSTRARSSSRTPAHRAGPSASSSHLPLGSTSSTSTTRRPSVDIGRPSLEARRPSVDVRKPSLDARRPSLDAGRPPLEARRPSLDTGRPSIETRRPSLDTPRASLDTRRPMFDQQRSPPLSPRTASPTSPARPRAISPTNRNYSPSPNYYQTRMYNSSTTSLGASATSSPECRELIHSASSFLCKEMLRPRTSMQQKEAEEVEVRMGRLSRLERVWGKSGVGMGSSSQLGTGSGGISAGGEERERRLFSEALRDGYVLCQLMNKLFPNMISRIDVREDGLTRNISRFLKACSTVGLQSDELFSRDDLIESNAESLARVAKTVLALQKLAETLGDKVQVIQGQGAQSQSPYSNGTGSRGAASTPNLSSVQIHMSTSPTSPHAPTGRKRWSPPQPLPTLRSDSPIEDGSGASNDGRTAGNSTAQGGSDVPVDSERDDVPPIMSPPPRAPLRSRASVERSSVADSTRASVGESVRTSMADSFASPPPTRQSQASSYMTDSTMFSSLLEVQRTNSGNHNKFGTIRTVTTEATSVDPCDPPSFSFTEGSSMAASLTEEIARMRNGDVPTRPSRERRPSETAVIDLSRVIEETDECSSTSGGKLKSKASGTKADVDKEKPSAIKLGKGKWPDDFMDAFQAPARSALLDEDELSVSTPQTPLSISPPRKLSFIGASKPDGSVESLPQFPRRPTHRTRHSVDTPGLLPKESILRRDSSPDNQPPSPRLVLRRNTSRAGAHRNGLYIPRSDSRSQDSESRVPFPRTVSAERTASPTQERPSVTFPPTIPDNSPKELTASHDKPRQPRGRFQSEIEGSSSRRKPRPNSLDELGAKPRRSRYESMVNLGVATSNASASDLLSRDSYEGSAVRQTLIVKEDGKPATQFQLGNCIGRGQFGAVYRALNLNTGQMVAVKRIRLEGLKEDEIAQLMKEVDLVKSLSHPSIVKYEGMARDDDTLSIVLEYAENGSLGQTLKAFGKLNERLVAGYVVKILEGLHYLHQSDVVHCDLKAANILTTKNGNVKLSDFGVSLNLRAMEREMKDVAGTPNWMAPEVIELKGASTKSDIWSLACTVIELLTGRPPYAEIPNSMSVMFRIVEDEMPPLPEGCSETLQDFLRQCFNKDPTKRPSAEILCEHEWLKRNWAIHNKELRPQDSIPFLRRVSADYQKSDAFRYLANIEMPDPNRATPEQRMRLDGSPARRRMSNDLEGVPPREHSFVRTTFGKPVICRVCNQSVKKSAVLCEQCSLISHVKCSANAPPTCDLRAQLLLYAQYAESGNPTGQYGDPMELLDALRANGPASPISDSDPTPRTSVDSSIPQSPPVGGHVHPPTAYKVLAAFKRSKSFMTDQDRPSSASSSTPSPVPSPSVNEHRQVTKKRSILKRRSIIKERPKSIHSESTSPNTSSLRSAITTSESLSSSTRRSARSAATETGNGVHENDKSDSKFSQLSSYSVISSTSTRRKSSGDGPRGSRDRHHDRDSKSSNGGCTVQ
ncbi:Pkinase-domain-containing protein [Wolfiporia cocos MD-104 SS10]|uniref:Pkinase-domain-containing protein n=1 Tax=Wolfiporia cocos (strain MD-104) TaxID=742152 RepID=A0A2H3JWH5_WOLCO|nr:Pkinase-domain-containing protein [Wolfiporia cocos MD-104 SS10]